MAWFYLIFESLVLSLKLKNSGFDIYDIVTVVGANTLVLTFSAFTLMAQLGNVMQRRILCIGLAITFVSAAVRIYQYANI
jgi:hypothetical protein